MLRTTLSLLARFEQVGQWAAWRQGPLDSDHEPALSWHEALHASPGAHVLLERSGVTQLRGSLGVETGGVLSPG